MLPKEVHMNNKHSGIGTLIVVVLVLSAIIGGVF